MHTDRKKTASLLAAFLLGILVASFCPLTRHEARYVPFAENKILDVSTGRVYLQSTNKTWQIATEKVRKQKPLLPPPKLPGRKTTQGESV
jgi:hypothetical protein